MEHTVGIREMFVVGKPSTFFLVSSMVMECFKPKHGGWHLNSCCRLHWEVAKPTGASRSAACGCSDLFCTSNYLSLLHTYFCIYFDTSVEPRLLQEVRVKIIGKFIRGKELSLLFKPPMTTEGWKNQMIILDPQIISRSPRILKETFSEF